MKIKPGQELPCRRCPKKWFPPKDGGRICPSRKTAFWDTPT
jgi:hypothetical protein